MLTGALERRPGSEKSLSRRDIGQPELIVCVNLIAPAAATPARNIVEPSRKVKVVLPPLDDDVPRKVFVDETELGDAIMSVAVANPLTRIALPLAPATLKSARVAAPWPALRLTVVVAWSLSRKTCSVPGPPVTVSPAAACTIAAPEPPVIDCDPRMPSI